VLGFIKPDANFHSDRVVGRAFSGRSHPGSVDSRQIVREILFILYVYRLGAGYLGDTLGHIRLYRETLSESGGLLADTVHNARIRLWSNFRNIPARLRASRDTGSFDAMEHGGDIWPDISVGCCPCASIAKLERS
jgi:hypothetical protein